jgi:hypothetical protein
MLSDDFCDELNEIAESWLDNLDYSKPPSPNKTKWEAFGKACERHYEVTGHRLRSPADFYHHRRSDWGPVCDKCGNLLRTPEARYCAECWTPKASN